jgi:hypothetical protein
MAKPAEYAEAHQGTEVVATEYQDEATLRGDYGDAYRENRRRIEAQGGTVHSGIDATNLATHQPQLGPQFSKVRFDYPHTGDYGEDLDEEAAAASVAENSALMRGTFESSGLALRPNGKLVIRTGGFPYHDKPLGVGQVRRGLDLDALAGEAGFVRVGRKALRREVAERTKTGAAPVEFPRPFKHTFKRRGEATREELLAGQSGRVEEAEFREGSRRAAQSKGVSRQQRQQALESVEGGAASWRAFQDRRLKKTSGKKKTSKKKPGGP